MCNRITGPSYAGLRVTWTPLLSGLGGVVEPMTHSMDISTYALDLQQIYMT